MENEDNSLSYEKCYDAEGKFWYYRPEDIVKFVKKLKAFITEQMKKVEMLDMKDKQATGRYYTRDGMLMRIKEEINSIFGNDLI